MAKKKEYKRFIEDIISFLKENEQSRNIDNLTINLFINAKKIIIKAIAESYFRKPVIGGEYSYNGTYKIPSSNCWMEYDLPKTMEDYLISQNIDITRSLYAPYRVGLHLLERSPDDVVNLDELKKWIRNKS